MTSRPIILVDPSEAREVLAERLRMQGYAVIVAATPVEGAGLALADPPAALVADLWMPGISGVQLCRLLRAEAATEQVPVILRGPEQDRHSRFWAERAGAAAYVGRGRMGDLVRALGAAIAAHPVSDDNAFIQLCGDEESEIRDRIAAHLDEALFESVVASEVRALSACGSFARLFDLLSQFVARVTSYRWLAVHAPRPGWLGIHAHPRSRERAEREAREAVARFTGATDLQSQIALAVEDEDAYADATGAEPILCAVRLGAEAIGTLALAPREVPHPKDRQLVQVVARELAGPLRIAALVEESQRLATTDPLTGLMNRRAFSAAVEREIQRSQRHGDPLSMVLLDVDHFKSINDLRGHPAGDAVLAALGRLLSSQVRNIDYTGRWGGEEFVVALVGTGATGARTAAERLRAAIQALEVHDQAGHPIPVTASFGIATYHLGDRLGALVDRADRAMYEAKTSGRNRVCAAPEASPPATDPPAVAAPPAA